MPAQFEFICPYCSHPIPVTPEVYQRREPLGCEGCEKQIDTNLWVSIYELQLKRAEVFLRKDES